LNGQSALAGRRILIVEDEYFLADDLRQILSDQRTEVLGPVATIANALSVIPNAGPIDCAVLEINLGGGHSQLRTLNAEQGNAPLVPCDPRVPAGTEAHVLRWLAGNA